MISPELLDFYLFFTGFEDTQFEPIAGRTGKFQKNPLSPSVESAIERMADWTFGTLLALDEGQLFGIVSEGTTLKKMILIGESYGETEIREILNRNVIYASDNQIVEKCLALTLENRVWHLPVVVDGQFLGIISMEVLAREFLKK